MRILLVEDDPSLGDFVQLGLEQEGLSVHWVADGLVAEQELSTRSYDVVVLDLGLPGIDGETLLNRWRARAQRTPIIVLTARGLVTDRVRLLNSGADDYLSKPFDLLELCARLRAVARRSAAHDGAVLEFGALRLHLRTRVAVLHGERVDLTDRELRLLETMLRDRGRTIAPVELIDAIGGQGRQVGSNTIEVHIHNLRRKLGRNVIVTVRGKGYRLASDPRAVWCEQNPSCAA